MMARTGRVLGKNKCYEKASTRKMQVGYDADMDSQRHGDAGACDAGILRAFDVLGKRWNGPIIAVLDRRSMGFSELRRGVGAITDSVLSDRLVELVEAGIVERSTTEGPRPQISYSLTERGCQLQPILRQLGAWAQGLAPLDGRR